MNQILQVLGNIGFDWQVALANFINFIVIFFILKKFAWKPLQEKLTQRQKIVNESVSQSKEASKQLENAHKEAESITQNAKDKARSILDLAEETKKKKIADAQIEAKQEAVVIVSRAEEEAEGLKKKKEEEFMKEAKNLVSLAVEKIIGDKTDSQEIEKHIKNSIKA